MTEKVCLLIIQKLRKKTKKFRNSKTKIYLMLYYNLPLPFCFFVFINKFYLFLHP